MPLFAPNRYKGKLIVVEGIDGSGKSTQISLLSQWLNKEICVDLPEPSMPSTTISLPL